MPFIENKTEFIQRQESDYIQTAEGTVFQNGALIDKFGQMLDPPTDRHELYERKLAYLRAVWEEAKRKYSNQRTQLELQLQFAIAKAGPDPEESWIDEVEALAQEVAEARDAIAEFKASYKAEEIARDPGYEANRERIEQLQENQERLRQRIRYLPKVEDSEPRAPEFLGDALKTKLNYVGPA